MKNIIHLSYDIRDRYDRKVTPAVYNLINSSKPETNPFIVSLARVSNIFNEKIELKNKDHLMLNVFGLPLGILMSWSQERAYKFIKKSQSKFDLDLKNINLIHSHKLSFEGLIGYRLAVEYDLPLIITLRQTDTMVINKKPGAMQTYKPIIERCNAFIYMIPQILVRMKKLFGKQYFDNHIRDKAVFIPNIVERERNFIKQDTTIKKRNFLTVLRMDKKIVKRKNLERLFIAISRLTDKNIKLTVVGDGNFRSEIEKWINKYDLKKFVELAGKINNEQIDRYYSEAEAFLLPSTSESFGLVYAESLLNGTPIMYSTADHLGFDGYFEGVGVGVDPLSVDSIKNGILDLLENSDNYRKNIQHLYDRGEFKIFNSDFVRERYISTLNQFQ